MRRSSFAATSCATLSIHGDAHDRRASTREQLGDLDYLTESSALGLPSSKHNKYELFRSLQGKVLSVHTEANFPGHFHLPLGETVGHYLENYPSHFQIFRETLISLTFPLPAYVSPVFQGHFI